MPQNKAKSRNPRQKLTAENVVDDANSDKENSQMNSNVRNRNIQEAQYELNTLFNNLIKDAFDSFSLHNNEQDQKKEREGNDEHGAKQPSGKGGGNVFLVNQVVEAIAGDDIKKDAARRPNSRAARTNAASN